MMPDGLDPSFVKWLDGKFEALGNKIEESDRRASDSRKDVHIKLEEQARTQIEMRHELETVKRDLSCMATSVEVSQRRDAEFAEWKAQAVGAGKLGRFLWFCGGLLLFGAYWVVSRWDSIRAGWAAFSGK